MCVSSLGDAGMWLVCMSPGNCAYLFFKMPCSHFDQQDFAGVIIGVTNMRYSPTNKWLSAFEHQLDQQVHIISPHKLNMIRTALDTLNSSSSSQIRG